MWILAQFYGTKFLNHKRDNFFFCENERNSPIKTEFFLDFFLWWPVCSFNQFICARRDKKITHFLKKKGTILPPCQCCNKNRCSVDKHFFFYNKIILLKNKKKNEKHERKSPTLRICNNLNIYWYGMQFYLIFFFAKYCSINSNKNHWTDCWCVMCPTNGHLAAATTTTNININVYE